MSVKHSCSNLNPNLQADVAILAVCWLMRIFLLPMQTASKLYLVLDFINGGHLFFQLYRHGIFDEDLARLYTAEMVLAIAHLHSLGIAHRDLKPVSPVSTDAAKFLPAAIPFTVCLAATLLLYEQHVLTALLQHVHVGAAVGFMSTHQAGPGI